MWLAIHMTTQPTATVTTEAGNICHIDLETTVADCILPWHTAEGEQPNIGRIAAQLAGRHFDSFANLNMAIADIVGNDASVFDVPQPTEMLHDSDTTEVIGVATAEQIEASHRTVEGHILVDADGDVVEPGTWAAQQPGVRRCYVQ